MKKKVLLDTTVWISALGEREDLQRVARARQVLRFLEENRAEFVVCYSERTTRELVRPIAELQQYQLVQYHSNNETWDKIEATWDNWGTNLGNSVEAELGEAAEASLPDKSKRPNDRRDRGIFGDAVLEGCRFLVHENPRDFDRLSDLAAQYGLTLIDLLKTDANEAILVLHRC